MRFLLWLLVVAGAFHSSVAASTIQVQVNTLGPRTFRYTYHLSGFALQVNQELDIHFDPLLYGTLSNGVASSDFDLILLQPNNPPGFPGDYSALALVNNPSMAGPFSVDFVYLGLGQPSAPQAYSINQFSENHNFLGIVASGVIGVPEPASVWLVGLGVLLLLLARRHINNRA